MEKRQRQDRISLSNFNEKSLWSDQGFSSVFVYLLDFSGGFPPVFSEFVGKTVMKHQDSSPESQDIGVEF